MLQPTLSRKGTALPTIFSLNVNMTRINTDEISNNNGYFSQVLFILSACAIFFLWRDVKMSTPSITERRNNKQYKNILDQTLGH